jgi:hypothetical protein
VNGELRAFAKKNFHRLRREMAVPRTDVDDERTLTAGEARQRFAQSRINRLPNHVFDDGAMWCWCSYSHKI